jgi:F-type H+-transporting ATPase subunit a
MNEKIYYMTPLEQFEISILRPFFIFNWDISFTNNSLFLCMTVFAIASLYLFSLYRVSLVPGYYQSIVEIIYEFVLDMIKQQIGERGMAYFPFLFMLFNFILFSNLLGLFPFGFTTTAHIVVTATLALSINIGILIIGFVNNGIKFLNLFIPSEAPIVLLPLIITIEIVSYCLRTFSLSVRLCANMMAGHLLLYILCSFTIALLQSSFVVFGFIPFVLILAITALEFVIAFVQAYVFIVLSSIYLNDSMNHF